MTEQHSARHKHLARNKFHSAKRALARSATHVDSDARSFKSAQDRLVAFCVDHLVAHFELEGFFARELLGESRLVLDVLARAEHLAANVAVTDVQRLQCLHAKVRHHLRSAKIERGFVKVFDHFFDALCVNKTLSVAALCVLVGQHQSVFEVGIFACKLFEFFIEDCNFGISCAVQEINLSVKTFFKHFSYH